MIEETLLEAGEKMDKAVEVAKEDFASIRTGRANPGLYNKVLVDYYGSPTPLQQLASFAIPDARTILITPFDKTALRDIERALSDSEVGANPSNDGNIIRITIPDLTQERRKEYVKIVKAKGEDAKVSIRNIRRKAKETLDKLVKDGEAGEDEGSRGEKELDAMTKPTSTASTSCSSARKPSCSRSDGAGRAGHPGTTGPRTRGKQPEEPDAQGRPESSRRHRGGPRPCSSASSGTAVPSAGVRVVVTTFAVFGVWEVFRALEATGTRLPIVPVMVGHGGDAVRRLFRRPGKPALRDAARQRRGAPVALPRRRRRLGAQHFRRGLHAGLGPVPDQLRRAAAACHRWSRPRWGSGPADVFRPEPGRWPPCCCWWSPTTPSATSWAPPSASTRWRPKISPKSPGKASPDRSPGPRGRCARRRLPSGQALVGRRGPGRGHGGRGHGRGPLRIHGQTRTRHQGHEQHPPGHGGVMDRLDSIVFASPVAFILFSIFAGA